MEIRMSYYTENEQVIDGWADCEDDHTIENDNELQELITSAKGWVSRYGVAVTIYDLTNKKMLWTHPNWDKIFDEHYS